MRIVVAAALVVAVAGCGGSGNPAPAVHENAGSLGGVHFGETAKQVRDKLGSPSDDAAGFFPKGAVYTGPPGIPSPDQGTGARPTPLHYGDRTYLVSPTVGVYAMATLAKGPKTDAGVAVGDPLAKVATSYKHIDCGQVPRGEAPAYDWCRATLPHVRVFFGGDPIRSITLTTR
jgi:hypothetical protein